MRRVVWLTDIHLNFLEPPALAALEDRLRQAAPEEAAEEAEAPPPGEGA